MKNFIVNKKYKRAQVIQLIGLPEGTKGGVYSNGYFKYDDNYYIFANVGVKGRTGHDYGNEFIGEDEFLWYAKNGTNIRQNQIKELISGNHEVCVFFREENRDDFTFAGYAKPLSHEDVTPVKIIWKIFPDKPIKVI